jgi:hypothetical protein
MELRCTLIRIQVLLQIQSDIPLLPTQQCSSKMSEEVLPSFLESAQSSDYLSVSIATDTEGDDVPA